MVLFIDWFGMCGKCFNFLGPNGVKKRGGFEKAILEGFTQIIGGFYYSQLGLVGKNSLWGGASGELVRVSVTGCLN